MAATAIENFEKLQYFPQQNDDFDVVSHTDATGPPGPSANKISPILKSKTAAVAILKHRNIAISQRPCKYF